MPTIAEDIRSATTAFDIPLGPSDWTLAAGYTLWGDDCAVFNHYNISFANHGTLISALYGFEAINATTTLVNAASGVILAENTAVWIHEAGSIAITNAGKVTSYDWGIYIDFQISGFSLNNSGIVSAAKPIHLLSDLTGGTITNSGLIRSTDSHPIRIDTGNGLVTRIVNQKTGTIVTAGEGAIDVFGLGAIHLTNAGRIVGFVNGGGERDVVINNGKILGTVALNGGNDLYQASNTGTVPNNLTIFGGSGNDRVIGGGKSETIAGGTERDLVTGGGGGDVFRYFEFTHSPVGAARDVITDFSRGQKDKLDFHQGGDGGGGAVTLEYRGKQPLRAGHTDIRYQQQNPAGTANDKTFILADYTGDGIADLQIELKGLINFVRGDFILSA